MKSLSISTALSVLILSAAAPFAWAVGDSNTDTGVGSAASRGPFGFSNNNDAIYDTPPNSYGVYRDAHGALRDRGMIPDNLTTNVPEPTWEEAQRMNPGPMPGGGAPGGLGGGGIGLPFGGLGGGFPIGGFGLGAGLGAGFGAIGGAFPTVGAAFPSLGLVGSPGPFQFPVGTASNAIGFNGAGNAAIGVNGIGPASQALRTQLGFANSPGNSSFNTWPAQQQHFLGPGSGFLPNFSMTVQNTLLPNGGNRIERSQQTPMGLLRERVTHTTQPNGMSNILREFWSNGNHWQTRETVTTASITSDPSWTNTWSKEFRTTDFSQQSNNGFTNPFVQNNPNNLADNSAIARGSSGNFGAGFATPSTSGDQRSAFFTDSQATGNSGGFSTPRSSGSERSQMFTSDFNQGNLGGFATPATSGSERSIVFGNTNNRFGGSGFGGGIGGGISGGTGNRAFRGGGGSGSGGDGGGGDVKSDGSLSRTDTGTSTGADAGAGSTSDGPGFQSGAVSRAPGGANFSGGFMGAGLMNGAGGFQSGVMGPLTQGGGPMVGTMGARMAVGPAPIDMSLLAFGEGMRRVIPHTATKGGARNFFNEMEIAPNVQSRVNEVRRMNQGAVVVGTGTNNNVSMSLESKLAQMNLTPTQALGRVIGSMRFENGDVITYGSKGTLRLAPDNSGSLTLNSGEILTFKKVSPALRSIALRSTLLM